MKQKRYGDCEAQHAESTIKSGIRGWVKERESFDGIARSNQEIEEAVTDLFKEAVVLSGYPEKACQFVNCDME
jgi:hypothetical protein